MGNLFKEALKSHLNHLQDQLKSISTEDYALRLEANDSIFTYSLLQQ
jgi:hypothetical protein